MAVEHVDPARLELARRYPADPHSAEGVHGVLQRGAAELYQQDAGVGRFCTIACLHLDLGRSPARMTVACGGHPLPVLVRGDGTTEEIGAAGTLLGLVPDPSLQDRTAELQEGELLVLYTDGLAEAGAPERVWTPEELAGEAAQGVGGPAAQMVQRLLDVAIRPLGAARDDVAVLTLRATA